MRRLLLVVCILIMSFSIGFAANTQKIHPVNSQVYEAISLLYISNGYALPSTGGPWSTDELLKMLEKIDRSTQSEAGKSVFDFVVENLKEGDKAVRFGLDVALEGYFHTDTTNFTKENQWIRGYNERKPLLDIVLETWPSKHFYGYSSLPVMGTKFNDYTAADGPVSYFFGQDAFATNLFFLAPGSINELDFGMPYRAFGAFGGDGWSVQVGRDQLSWGPGKTGNFMLGDHLKYHNVGRLTTYGKNFKYTFATSFFPHPDQYYPIIDGSGSYMPVKDQSQELKGLNMFLAHRLEWRMFGDKVGVALSESVMYRSLDNTLDLRILSPTMIFHNYYIRSNANSLVSLELDYSPIKHVNVYGQIVVDEFALPGEPVVGAQNGAHPDGFGYMAGAKGSYPMGKGMLYGSFEWAQTDPFLYLRYNQSSTNTDPETYGLNYIVAIREYYKLGIIYDEDFIGYQYGPDAIVLNGNIGYREFGKWYAEGNIFYMFHGTHDKWTKWTHFDIGDTYIPTPTDDHLTGNYGDKDAQANRDAVSQTLVVGVKGGYTLLPGFDVYAQADYINIMNPGNISSNPAISDVQLTFGVSYSL